MKENVCEECGGNLIKLNSGIDINENEFANLDLYQCVCCRRLSYIQN